MGEQFNVQFHHEQALKYENQANTGAGDPVASAQLAVMHATLAVAATNRDLYALHEVNGRSICRGLEMVESQLADIGNKMAPQ
ncbi:MAG TPA: hypothetical protein VIQ30_20815 [Pseudonocardia sp.]